MGTFEIFGDWTLPIFLGIFVVLLLVLRRMMIRMIDPTDNPLIQREATSVPDGEKQIYTVVEDDLSQGYEDVYNPLVVLKNRDSGLTELVLGRLIDGTDDMYTLKDARKEFLNYAKGRYGNKSAKFTSFLDVDDLTFYESQEIEKLKSALENIHEEQCKEG